MINIRIYALALALLLVMPVIVMAQGTDIPGADVLGAVIDLVLGQNTTAQSSDSQGSDDPATSCNGVGILDPKFPECIPQMIIGASADLVIAIFKPLIGFIKDFVVFLIEKSLSLLKGLFNFSIPLDGAIKTSYDESKDIALSLASLALSITGLYWIVGARSVEGRMKAKKMIESLLIVLLLMGIGDVLFKIVIDINGFLVDKFLQKSVFDMFKTSELFGTGAGIFGTVAAIILFSISLAGFVTTAMTLVARYFLIYVFFVLFPFTLMFYFINFTKPLGRALLALTLVTIFIGALDAFLLFVIHASLAPLDALLNISGVVKPLFITMMFLIMGSINIFAFLAIPMMFVPELEGAVKMAAMTAGMPGGSALMSRGISRFASTPAGKTINQRAYAPARKAFHGRFGKYLANTPADAKSRY